MCSVVCYYCHRKYPSVVCTCMKCWLFVEQNNETALEQACWKGHDEVVRVLLAAKATVNMQDKVSYGQIYM